MRWCIFLFIIEDIPCGDGVPRAGILGAEGSRVVELSFPLRLLFAIRELALQRAQRHFSSCLHFLALMQRAEKR